jgi:hypothetical protein
MHSNPQILIPVSKKNLELFLVHDIEDMWGNGGVVPCILDLFIV